MFFGMWYVRGDILCFMQSYTVAKNLIASWLFDHKRWRFSRCFNNFIYNIHLHIRKQLQRTNRIEELREFKSELRCSNNKRRTNYRIYEFITNSFVLTAVNNQWTTLVQLKRWYFLYSQTTGNQIFKKDRKNFQKIIFLNVHIILEFLWFFFCSFSKKFEKKNLNVLCSQEYHICIIDTFSKFPYFSGVLTISQESKYPISMLIIHVYNKKKIRT